MKIQVRSLLVAVAAFVFGLSPLKAALIISNFHLTNNSVSFDINGTFPSSVPEADQASISFVNPNVSASPGFALDNFLISSSASFTGSQILSSGNGSVYTSWHPAGDFLVIVFESYFSANEAINGSLSATWSSAAFDPTAVSSLNVFWGIDADSPFPSYITGGTFLTSVDVNTAGVPEPSTYAMMLLLTSAGAIWWVRGRKRVRAS